MNWDQYFMSMAFLIAMKSKDLSTQIGAVIVDNKNRIVGTGYNGFVSGSIESEERWSKPEKYEWVIHAEVNSILNATKDLDSCVMYTNGVPCLQCATKIAQVGIKEVVVDYVWDAANYNQWLESAQKTKQLFEECGIKIRYYKDELITEIVLRHNGKSWQVKRRER